MRRRVGKRIAGEQCLCRSTIRAILYSAADGVVRALKAAVSDDFGTLLFRVEASGPIRSLCFDGQDDLLILGVASEIELVRGKNGLSLGRYPCPILTMCFSEASRLLFTSSKEEARSVGVLRVWKLGESSCLQEVGREEDLCDTLGDRYIHALAFDSLGRRLFAGRNNGTVRTFLVDACGSKLTVIADFRASDQRVCTVLHCQERSVFFTVDRRARLRVWDCPADIQGRKALNLMCEPKDSVSSIAFDAGLQLLFTSSKDGTLVVRRLGRGSDEIGADLQEVYRTSLGDPGDVQISALEYSAAGRSVFAAEQDGRSYVARVLCDGVLSAFRAGKYTMEEDVRKATCATYDPSQRLLVAGFADGGVGVWRVSAWGQTTSISQIEDAHGGAVSCLVFDSFRGLIITSSDEDLFVWQATADYTAFVEVERERSVTRGSFSLQEGDTERPHEYMKRRRSRRSTAGLRSINCMVYDSKAQLLVTGEELAADGILRLWRLCSNGAPEPMPAAKIQVANGGFQALHLAPDPILGLLMLSGAGNHDLASWRISPVGIEPLYTNPFAHNAKDEAFSLEYDQALRLCFTAGFDGVVRVWRVSSEAAFEEVSRFAVAATPYGAQEPTLPEKQTRLRYLPADRFLITHGSGTSRPRLWRISKDGEHCRELWFPSHLYRGEADLAVAAPSSELNDRHGCVWFRTRSGRWVAVSLTQLFHNSLVCTLEAGSTPIASIVNWWLPGPLFLGKVIVMLVSFMQLLYLGLMCGIHPPVLQKPVGIIRMFARFTIPEWPFYDEFVVAMGTILIACLLFVFAEVMSELMWTSPDSLCQGLIVAAINVWMMCISSVGILPLLGSLLEPAACIEHDGRWVIQADITIECWSFRHLTSFVFFGLFGAGVVVYVGARLSRVQNSLDRIQLRWNLLDWSGDCLHSEDEIVRRSPLQAKDTVYDFRVVVIEFVAYTGKTFVPMLSFGFGDNQDGLVTKQELQQVVLSAVICVCGALLVRTSFLRDRFFDHGVNNGLTLPLGLEANAISAGLNVGICWLYFTQFVVAAATLTTRSSDTFEAMKAYLSAGLFVTMFVGYYLRARRRTTGRRWVARAMSARPGERRESEPFVGSVLSMTPSSRSDLVRFAAGADDASTSWRVGTFQKEQSIEMQAFSPSTRGFPSAIARV